VVATVAIVGAGIILFKPSTSQTIALQMWMRYYVFAGVITGAVLFARTGPAVFCEARRMIAQEPLALITAMLVVGGAPVLLLPFVVSAWPLVALWMVSAWLERRAPLG
jgi:hypothetical protein